MFFGIQFLSAEQELSRVTGTVHKALRSISNVHDRSWVLKYVAVPLLAGVPGALLILAGLYEGVRNWVAGNLWLALILALIPSFQMLVGKAITDLVRRPRLLTAGDYSLLLGSIDSIVGAKSERFENTCVDFARRMDDCNSAAEAKELALAIFERITNPIAQIQMSGDKIWSHFRAVHPDGAVQFEVAIARMTLTGGFEDFIAFVPGHRKPQVPAERYNHRCCGYCKAVEYTRDSTNRSTIIVEDVSKELEKPDDQRLSFIHVFPPSCRIHVVLVRRGLSWGSDTRAQGGPSR